MSDIEIYPVDARITVSIGSVKFIVRPLNSHEQNICLSLVYSNAGKTTVDKMEQMRQTLKYALKDIKGVKMFGKPYKLSFDDDGLLTDDCLEEIGQIGQEKHLTALMTRWLNDGIHDPKFKGVQIEFPKSRQKN